MPALTDATFFEDLARVPDVSIDSGEPQGPVCAGIEVPVTF